MPEGCRDGDAVAAPIEELSPAEPNSAVFSGVSRYFRFRPEAV